jgi:hypothetical protein
MRANLAERLGWQVARRLYRKELVDGVDPLATGAVRDEFVHVLRELGGIDLRGDVRGQGVQRELVPRVQYERLDGLKSRFGIARLQALPELWFSDEATMRLVGFHAHHVRHGVCQRGAAKRPGPRTTGPVCPEALANTVVKLDVRALARLCNGSLRAVAKAGVLPAKVTGMVEGTDLETTAPSEGGGQVTRKRPMTDKRGRGHAIAVTVEG